MVLWILILPFLVLSLFEVMMLMYLYQDIFIDGDFITRNRNVAWYYLVATMFMTGIPLWLATGYVIFREWNSNPSEFPWVAFYLLVSYVSLFWMFLGHTYPPLWVTMFVLHVLFLVLPVILVAIKKR